MKTNLKAGCVTMAAATILVLSSAATMAAPGFAAAPSLYDGYIVTVDKKDGVDVDINLGASGDRHSYEQGYEDGYYDRNNGPDYYRERGYSSYDARPDDWRDRSCVGVGPLHFCK